MATLWFSGIMDNSARQLFSPPASWRSPERTAFYVPSEVKYVSHLEHAKNLFCCSFAQSGEPGGHMPTRTPIEDVSARISGAQSTS